MLICLSNVQFRQSPAVQMWCLQPPVNQTHNSMRPSSPNCAPFCKVRVISISHSSARLAAFSVLTTLFCVSDADAPWTKEVSGVLFPLFVYLHLNMARCGLKGAVDSFYGRFHSLFQQDPEQKAIVDLLRGVVSVQVSHCITIDALKNLDPSL